MRQHKIKDNCENSDWYAHWWRQSRIADVDVKGKTKPKTDAEFWFDHYWKPRELAIWIYELVRRLPNTKIQSDTISDGDEAILRTMPPYLKLSLQQKTLLVSIITRVLDSKLINEEASALYNSAARSHLPEWQQGQPHKLTDWRQVEVLDKKEAEQNEGEKKARWEIRRQARERAMIFLPMVLSVWRLMHDELLEKIGVPPLRDAQAHPLSGAVISVSDLEAALKRAI